MQVFSLKSLIGALLVMMGCKAEKTTTTTSIEHFTLPYQEVVSLEYYGTKLQMELVAISESRCPPHMRCITDGCAIFKVAINDADTLYFGQGNRQLLKHQGVTDRDTLQGHVLIMKNKGYDVTEDFGKVDQYFLELGVE